MKKKGLSLAQKMEPGIENEDNLWNLEGQRNRFSRRAFKRNANQLTPDSRPVKPHKTSDLQNCKRII